MGKTATVMLNSSKVEKSVQSAITMTEGVLANRVGPDAPLPTSLSSHAQRFGVTDPLRGRDRKFTAFTQPRDLFAQTPLEHPCRASLDAFAQSFRRQ